MIILPTCVTVDKVSPSGLIYEREHLANAINEFNIMARSKTIYSGILDRKHIQSINKITHRDRRLFIHDNGLVYAEIDPIDDTLDYTKYIARPVMSLPAYVLDIKPVIVNTAFRIMRIQIELINETR
jgi:hypothetical protein